VARFSSHAEDVVAIILGPRPQEEGRFTRRELMTIDGTSCSVLEAEFTDCL
jgi:hypothetical protein